MQSQVVPAPSGEADGLPQVQESVLEPPAFGDARLPTRFWAKVKVSETGCWLWTASTNTGYGQFVSAASSSSKLAHRVVYETLISKIPVGLTLDHLCRIRSCVNPLHLEPVTNRENILRGTSPSAQSARVTTCPRGHPYVGRNLISRKVAESQRTHGLTRMKRICRTCLSQRMHQWWRFSPNSPRNKTRLPEEL